MKLLVRRIDLGNRPSTRSFTHSWSRHAAQLLTCPSTRLARAQWYFSEAAAELDAARLVAYQAARDLDSGGDFQRSSSAAKLLASTLATKVASMAVQVCGAHGTQETSPYGRYFRDAKTYEVAGGSVEILKDTIAKSLIKAADTSA